MNALRLLGFLFLLSLGATLFLMGGVVPGSPPPGGTRIEVASGQTVRDIAAMLKREGIIRSTLAFRWYLQSRGIDRKLRPGTFLIASDARYADLARMLMEGTGTEVIVTIPEGFTLAQIDDHLAALGLTQPGDILRCAQGGCAFSSFTFLPAELPRGAPMKSSRVEGFLFPDTYYVNVEGFTPERFLERLLRTFHERVVEDLAEDIAVSGRSLHDITVMASLIERETRTEEERPVIAGILWKRLDSGRALDVDATVRYAVGKPEGPLTRENLQVDSPYNTRRSAGLPPGPIANPGLASIKAALYPQHSSFWFYLHGRDGQVRYAETNDEHNENKARYL